MKKYVIFVLCLIAALVSCSDDDETNPTKPYIDKNVYTNPIVGLTLRIPFDWTMHKVQDSIYSYNTEWIEGGVDVGNLFVSFGLSMYQDSIADFTIYIDDMIEFAQNQSLYENFDVFERGSITVDGKAGAYYIANVTLTGYQHQLVEYIFNHRGYSFTLLFMITDDAYLDFKDDLDFIIQSIELY